MDYIKKIPDKPTFVQKGVEGYQFKLENKDLEIYFEKSNLGHDDFVKGQNFTHFYYILEGEGFFTINNIQHEVAKGMVVEIPPMTEFSFTGKMELILIVDRPFAPENLEITKRNLDF